MSIRVFCGLAATLAAAACAGGTAAPMPSATRSAETEALEALYLARQDSALQKVSEADVAFMTGMISHHAQALVMSAMSEEAGASSAIRTLTSRIINAQKDEIRVMQTWLRDRGRPILEVTDEGELHVAGDIDHAMEMPGMLSAEQLGELRAARGPAFDRLFLAYMIQHHQGAVTMVHELFAIDGAALDDTVFKVASDIQVDQVTEINRMRLMLQDLPDPRRR